MPSYKTAPADQTGMPKGIPYIVGNEAAERFSYYGMKAILAVFMVHYLHLMDPVATRAMSEAQATEKYHIFNVAVYATPVIGAILADMVFGKYRTIIWLSVIYCIGHAALALMGTAGPSYPWLLAGLFLIALGSGGIKPCVSAHVGDQFGVSNARLLPRIFNWFYFSINFGALISMLLTPWLLEWYGPHLAFGIPGVLMAIATIVFWMGRKVFVHIPAHPKRFVRELTSKAGISSLLKLIPLYLFVAMFWALFDQTGSTWVFQSLDMDRNLLGTEWLPSQIQSLNSVFILTFIPLFSYVLYPFVGKFIDFTPLRKIGTGLFLMAGAFALIALIQHWIDDGQRPHISWQVLAYALLSASEVLVAIVALEFAYTQAPKALKSVIMCYFLLSVAVGNAIVAAVNHFIQLPNTAAAQFEQRIAELPADWQLDPRNVVLPGYDGKTGTADDFIQRTRGGNPTRLEIPGQEVFTIAIERIRDAAGDAEGNFPDDRSGARLLEDLSDPWGREIRYETRNSALVRLRSAGPDQRFGTAWDIGVLLEFQPPKKDTKKAWTDALHPEEPWLDRRMKQLGVDPESRDEEMFGSFKATRFSGGLTRLEGAPYFRFFMWLMIGAAVFFIPYAILYQEKTYLQDDGRQDDPAPDSPDPQRPRLPDDPGPALAP